VPMPTPRKHVRLFRSDALERLSHVHAATPVLLWAPVVSWLLWRSVVVERLEAATVIALGAAGLIAWSFVEYVLHRFVFHLASTSPGARRMQFVMHGVHHDDPNDSTRWLMPPIPAIAGGVVLFALARIFLGGTLVQPFFACFLIGYLAYDYTHFAVHHAGVRTRLGRYLRRRHLLHHFATPEARWGVTSPLWDWIFRTTGAGGAVLIGVIVLFASPAVAAGWEQLFEKDGVLVERRAVPGSSIPELRATATSPLEPSAIFETLWRHPEYPEFVPHLKRLDLLSDTGDERIAYEQIAMPLAKDRDYTVRIRRRVDRKAQRYEMTFTSANEAGPPADRRHVRVKSIQGSWTVVPGAEGKGSVVRYDVRGEPGGAIPAWVANLAQREAIVDLIRAVLERTERTGGRH